MRRNKADAAADERCMGLSFQRLDVYKCATDFLVLAAEISASTVRGNAPLLDQLRRAATSVTLNIAEAAGRTGKADAARAYAIARGSAMECAAILDALRALSSLTPGNHERGDLLLERIVAMLTRLCRGVLDAPATSPSPSPSPTTPTLSDWHWV